MNEDICEVRMQEERLRELAWIRNTIEAYFPFDKIWPLSSIFKLVETRLDGVEARLDKARKRAYPNIGM